MVYGYYLVTLSNLAEGSGFSVLSKEITSKAQIVCSLEKQSTERT